MTLSTERFTPGDLEQLQRQAPVGRIEFQEQVGSTNDWGLRLAGEAAVEGPVLLLTNQQTGGRGRGANRWWSAAGGLTFSLLLDADAARLPTERWPLVSLTVGLAVCETLAEYVSSNQTLLKWPNDVYLERRKVAGILVEPAAGPRRQLVIGVGLNVNNSFAGAPDPLPQTATSLSDATGRQFALTDVLLRLLARLDDRLGEVADDAPALLSEFRARCLLTGRQVRLNQGARSVAGKCQGIDHDGALVIETNAGLHRSFAGVVEYFS